MSTSNKSQKELCWKDRERKQEEEERERKEPILRKTMEALAELEDETREDILQQGETILDDIKDAERHGKKPTRKELMKRITSLRRGFRWGMQDVKKQIRESVRDLERGIIRSANDSGLIHVNIGREEHTMERSMYSMIRKYGGLVLMSPNRIGRIIIFPWGSQKIREGSGRMTIILPGGHYKATFVRRGFATYHLVEDRTE